MRNYNLEIFGTPLIVSKDNNDLLNNFYKIIKEHKKETENFTNQINADPHKKNYVSNTDGYTSFYKGSLLNNQKFKEIISYLNEKIIKILEEKEKISNFDLDWMDCWYTIYYKGNNVEEHFHPNSIISGVFYLKCPENCGNIIFFDTNYHYKNFCLNTSPLKTFTYPKSFSLKPEEGMLVLFPSWLTHKTEINMSDDERVIIAFNIIPKSSNSILSNSGSNLYHQKNHGFN